MNQDEEKKKEVISKMLAGWFGKWADAEPTKPTQSSNNGWISTTEQLPKPDTLVIIAVDLGLDTPKICLGSYAKDDTPITDDEGNTYSHSHWWNDDNDDFMWEFGEVKYWQPLPEFPHYPLTTVTPTNKGVKQMTKLLTPQEVLQALLNGKAVEYRVYDETDTDPDKWWDRLYVDDYPISCLLNGEYQFQLAQEMITIGNVSFPKAYQGEMEYGRTYYVPSVNSVELYSALEWEDNLTDGKYLSSGMLHLSKANAIAHAEALIRLSGGEI